MLARLMMTTVSRPRLPAEWERHAATWLSWPHHQADWPGKLEVIRWVYGEMARKISAGESIRLLVRHASDQASASRILRAAGVDLRKVQFIAQATNRSWTRDTGPIFVRTPGRGSARRAVLQLHFNGWAKYPNYTKDRQIPPMAAKRLGLPLLLAEAQGRPFTVEGGGIEVNGRGTLLTTEECYLQPRIQVRNPGLGRAGFESALRQFFGATNIFWLGRGIAGDDTHGHIDDLCRFVNPTTLVLVRETNPRDKNYRPLAENWERIRGLRLENGSRPEIVALPMPAPLYCEGIRLPASYANFYICNAAVLVPTFNDPNDRVALGILGELFRDRPVVGIHAVDLVWGLGTIHCLTQQEPAK